MKKLVMLSILFSLVAVIVISGSIQGQEPTPLPDNTLFGSGVVTPPTNQIIIQFTGEVASKSLLAADADGQLPALSAAAGVPLTYVRPMSDDTHVLALPDWTAEAEVAKMSVELTMLPGVVYAEPDRIKRIDTDTSKRILMPDLTPNDTLWGQMWHLKYTANTSEGVNLVPAWNISTGSASTVVAVIDTGILNHTDLAGKTVPGYDFIDDLFVANDGDGRDNDPADPGDWVTVNECGYAHSQRDSSWHGTHVAGTIGAKSNNNLGVTGVNWNAKILPVRVLGKCGGYTSDIVDGMKWAAGLSVTGVPNNAYPADVLNLSLGGYGACAISEQNAINAVVAAGATVVIAAGNDNANASGYSPGNCNNIITVAATDRTGDKAWYSNYGSIIEVSAPGGETAVSANGVLSTLDSGTTTPNNSNSYAFYQGTSMATPHVAGVASLIKGILPGYNQAQVLSLLQSTARPFPAGSGCNTSSCGAGIIDAYAALYEIANFVYLPMVIKTQPATSINSLATPGFESDPTGWTQYSSNGFDLIFGSSDQPVSPHSGS